jgi:hypothetical protein
MRYQQEQPGFGMAVGPDGKLSDILMQVIAGTLFGHALANIFDDYSEGN